jgi:hypothetical protein
VRRPEAIDQQVVDERALRRGQARILDLANLQLGRVVRGDVLHRLERALPRNFNFAHMRDVEQPRRGPYRHVLGGDAGILDGHVPASERDHPGAER